MRQAPTTQQKQKQVLAHLKVWLLRGKPITSNAAQQRWGTSRLAVYIRRLRERGMKIYTVIKQTGGDVYAEYSIKKPKDTSKIYYY